jgi:hypothetical protein
VPLPALDLTYQFSVNHVLAAQGSAIATSRALLFAIKQGFISFGVNPWAVRYSCNGTTAGTVNDGVDRWVTDADLVWSTGTSAKSWTVLRNADGFEVMIECRSGGATGRNLCVAVSASAHFTGGSTTVRPTATDEMVLIDGLSPGQSSWGQGSSGTTTDRGYAWHLLHSTDGLVTQLVICHNNNATGFWYLGRVSQPVTGWTLPVMGAIWADGATTPVSGAHYTEMADGANTDVGNPHALGRFPGGTAKLFATAIAFGTGTANTADYSGRRVTTINEVSSEWELQQVGLGCATPGFRGMSHGRLYDVRWTSTGTPTGTDFPADATRVRATFGNIVIAWNGTVPISS